MIRPLFRPMVRGLRSKLAARHRGEALARPKSVLFHGQAAAENQANDGLVAWIAPPARRVPNLAF